MGKKGDEGKMGEGKKRKDDGKKKKDVDESEEGGDDEDEEGAEADKDVPEKPKNNKVDKKKANELETVEAVVDEEDLNIQPDLSAVKAKYQGRKRLPLQPLPAEEYEERKIRNKPIVATKSKKKGANIDDDEGDGKKNRILVAPWSEGK